MDDSNDRQNVYHLAADRAELSGLAEPSVAFGDFNLTLAVATQCRAALQRFYGPRLKRVILFGSSARGEANSESDIDLLVLLAKPFDYFKELRRIVDLLYPIQLGSERMISALPAEIDEYERGAQQLYRNIQQDGQVV